MSSTRFILPKLQASTDAIQIMPAANGPMTFMLLMGEQPILCPMMDVSPSATAVQGARKGVGERLTVSCDKELLKRGIMTQVEAVPVTPEDVHKIERAPTKHNSCQTDESFTLECVVIDMLKSGKFFHLKRKSEVKDNLAVSLGFKRRDLKRFLKVSLSSVLNNIVSGEVQPDLWESVAEENCADGPTTVHAVAYELRKWCQKLVDEITTSRAKPYTNCPVCGKMTRQCYLKMHMRLHNHNSPHTCAVCHRQFTQLQSCKKHQDTHKADRERPYQCSQCSYKTFTKSCLDTHMETHKASENIECPTCGKKFKNEKNLQIHSARHSAASGHVCDICGKTYRNIYTVQSHRRIMHEGIRKSYPCDICDKVFTHSWTHRQHKLRHVIDRPFKCKVCGKAFTDSSVLKSHVLIHTGEKPFPCSVCGRAFRQSTALKTHMYTHGATRPHQCPKCAKQFIHKVYLTRHKCPFDDADRDEGIHAADSDEKKNESGLICQE